MLLICPVYAPHAGGGGQYFPLLVKELQQSSIIEKIVILTEANPRRARVSEEDNATIYRILPQRDTLSNKSKLYSVVSFLWTYLLLYTVVPYLIVRYRILILHYTRYLRHPMYLLTALSAKLFGIRVVLDMRATVEDDTVLRNLFGCHFIISNSEAVYRQVVGAGIDRGCHMLVENPMYFPTPYSEEELWRRIGGLSSAIRRPYLAFIGQLLERKSIAEVLDAFEAFSRDHPEYRLVIAGRNMMGPGIIKRIEEIKGVIFLGPVSHDQAVALIQGSEMVLQPSKIEGIPRVSLEALSLGKKVLLPPCVPEFVTACPQWCPKAPTATEIYNAITYISSVEGIPYYNLAKHDPSSSIRKVLTAYRKVQGYL